MMFILRKKPGNFYYPKDYPRRFVSLIRFQFKLKVLWRWLRVQRISTQLLGFQYQPSLDLIEIDITYQCNLRCHNCNRSSAQAPAAMHLALADIEKFVNDTIATGKHWRRIRVLGGEPTLHPEFMSIMHCLLSLKQLQLVDQLQLVSNGFGPKVSAILKQLPAGIEVENSSKTGNIQPSFGPFNEAPVDSELYRFTNFGNGCDIMHSCGIGLTPLGYYPCAVAGGIDRVTQAGSGRPTLPDAADHMRDLLNRNCQLCGRFKDGHYVPEKLRKPLLIQSTSPTWAAIYQKWRLQQTHRRHENR
ncbi:MAG: radical SAM protein [Nitrincola lacisaponensis]|uniref:radical SAM protein n=1 Tax=Nitrincola lacisaponensis TaxID=267850 RepID=UPI00391D123B